MSLGPRERANRGHPDRTSQAAGTLVELLPDTPPLPDLFRLLWRQGHPKGELLLALAEELRAIPLA